MSMLARVMLLAAGLLAAAPAYSAEAELPPGVAAERPSEGPFVEHDGVFLVPYWEQVPGADVRFEMIPVPGGELLLGSPDSEPGRADDEGPQRRVTLPPFWIAAREVSWAEYRPFMNLCAAFEKFNDAGTRPVTDENRVDAITAPSKLYEPSFTFAAGEDPQLPAVSMTQFSAKQYSKWISLVNERFYRLPTEAEWEHACRAGSGAAYAFGDGAEQLNQHAWHAGNSDEATHPVGQKRPNAWGLYDMHGNACEWVLDAYTPEGYAALPPGPTPSDQAVQWPTKLSPRTLRGGSALLDAERSRSAARRAADDEELKLYDPNTPTSPWWYANDEAQDIGFRLVRPYAAPAADGRAKVWDADVPTILRVANFRIEKEGRGEWGLADPDLPAALEALRRPSK
ncbi:Serine/threonine-protein kinase pkn1 [Pirellulimonas nuda]|uniref:Serine/threonine-protein kinase pkn1 n=1 Tax=Pirellulimonas nuda TaxID=2528009 RepID=A0A518DEB7_9BACT|nr:formylglycine-generating enzyme family protein [Pirellulimonas nuda]QDU89806.1 Serine/threonine-protein kinase pkn1 [Pirellulimonas nuda]